ncbi:RNA polymerase sigma factor [Enhygromyxa salina]|uniref:RNA polymerase sigma factor n=1 Tax=Enhygromyxa salina TaxID=215803 RepID=A0A2S9XFP4_9BACT|nr:RNA polymerase sigma factor [Enhygromyxa salina]PRP91685.1 RNA polymerase sigma factor [Enhygromyxa salina]
MTVAPTPSERSWELNIASSEFARINRELIHYFRHRVPNKDGNDLAAETWLRVVRWYRGRCSLRVFVYLVAKKLVVDTLYRARELETTPLLDGKEPVSEGPSPCSALIMLGDYELLDRSLEQVDEAYREVVQLSLRGRDNGQIATELAIPYNTVRSRLGRGRAQVVCAARAALGGE